MTMPRHAAQALGLRRGGLRQVLPTAPPTLVAAWEDVAMEKTIETKEGNI
jgi:hypothetical protein